MILRNYLIVALHFMSSCRGLEILIVVPNTIKSLNSIFIKLGEGLVERGHHVTFILPYPPSHNTSRITSIKYEIPEELSNVSIFEIASSMNKMIAHLYETSVTTADNLWRNPSIMELWKHRRKYDMIITMSYLNEVIFPFLIDNPAIFVQLCTPGVEAHSMSRQGNWLMPSVVPHIIFNLDDYMNFWERLINLPVTVFMHNLEIYLFWSYRKNYLKKYFPEIGNTYSYYDRVALTLINGHYSMDGPVPLLPNQVEIGTINIMKAKPLDKDLASFVEGSGEAGIIYFSLGSIAKSSDIPTRIKDMFVEAFKMVPQRILWKYEGRDLDLPPNVMTRKWMPQQDILGHPKTRVFISHCGNLGTQEAKYYGIPVLGVPITFDQPRNAARMERKGYAIVIQWNQLTTVKIVESLNVLVNDTSYKERLSAVSRVLQDQKESPLERAIWWLEYVARHKDSPHLQYAGKRLSVFQYFMLDVVLVLFFGLIILGLVFYNTCGLLFSICRAHPLYNSDKKIERKKKS